MASSESWPSGDSCETIHLHEGSARWRVPLFRENRSGGFWATFLITDQIASERGRPDSVVIPPLFDSGPTCAELDAQLGGAADAKLVGIVREGANLSRLRIEMLPDRQVSSGQIVVVPTSEGHVYHQVVGAETSEESFATSTMGRTSPLHLRLVSCSRSERFLRVASDVGFQLR